MGLFWKSEWGARKNSDHCLPSSVNFATRKSYYHKLVPQGLSSLHHSSGRIRSRAAASEVTHAHAHLLLSLQTLSKHHPRCPDAQIKEISSQFIPRSDQYSICSGFRVCGRLGVSERKGRGPVKSSTAWNYNSRQTPGGRAF